MTFDEYCELKEAYEPPPHELTAGNESQHVQNFAARKGKFTSFANGLHAGPKEATTCLNSGTAQAHRARRRSGRTRRDALGNRQGPQLARRRRQEQCTLMKSDSDYCEPMSGKEYARRDAENEKDWARKHRDTPPDSELVPGDESKFIGTLKVQKGCKYVIYERVSTKPQQTSLPARIQHLQEHITRRGGIVVRIITNVRRGNKVDRLISAVRRAQKDNAILVSTSVDRFVRNKHFHPKLRPNVRATPPSRQMSAQTSGLLF